jgi:hypothetical protein
MVLTFPNNFCSIHWKSTPVFGALLATSTSISFYTPYDHFQGTLIHLRLCLLGYRTGFSSCDCSLMSIRKQEYGMLPVMYEAQLIPMFNGKAFVSGHQSVRHPVEAKPSSELGRWWPVEWTNFLGKNRNCVLIRLLFVWEHFMSMQSAPLLYVA